MSEDAIDFDVLDRKDKRSAALIRKQLQPGLDLVLDNADGVAALLAISDEEWQEAIDAEDLDAS